MRPTATTRPADSHRHSLRRRQVGRGCWATLGPSRSSTTSLRISRATGSPGWRVKGRQTDLLSAARAASPTDTRSGGSRSSHWPGFHRSYKFDRLLKETFTSTMVFTANPHQSQLSSPATLPQRAPGPNQRCPSGSLLPLNQKTMDHCPAIDRLFSPRGHRLPRTR